MSHQGSFLFVDERKMSSRLRMVAVDAGQPPSSIGCDSGVDT
jgi:hypothetical protein